MVHDLIHDKCSASQIARILHKGDEHIEYHYVGKKGQHAAHAVYHAVGQHVAQCSLGEGAAHGFIQPLLAALDPLLRVGSQLERTVEHEPHRKEEDRVAPYAMRYQSIDALRLAVVIGAAGDESLLQGTRNESVLTVGKHGLHVVAQLALDRGGGTLGHAAPPLEARRRR